MSLLLEATTILDDVRSALTAGRTPESIRREVFGASGSFPALLRQVGSLPAEERPEVGGKLAAIRQEIDALLGGDRKEQVERIVVDKTVPAGELSLGTVHPISAMIERMVDIFARLSFEVVEGPELVGIEENFEMLNIHPDHPARDPRDTFYVDEAAGRLLRTQTTAVQVLEMRRRMKQQELPIRVVVPGKTYRRESDQTHSLMFHQIDAIMVDTQTTFSDLRGALDYFVRELFGDDVETRFRTHNFPFTEPSAEIDIRWKNAKPGEEGKHTQWLEMGGCGMIHPNVLKRAGINPRIYQGWAFGMSIERPLMVKYGIPDLRRLYENSTSFLTQFS